MYDLIIQNATVPVSLLGPAHPPGLPDAPATTGTNKSLTNSALMGCAVTDILIENGIITQIGQGLSKRYADVLDACGQYVLPGLIDMDCHSCDPGYENREDIASASKSAVKGGFTAITCQPHTWPVIDNKTVVNYVLAKSRRESLAHVFPYGAMTQGCKGEQIAEIGEMIRAGIVAVSNAGCVNNDAALLRNILIYTRMFNVTVITACNDPGLAGAGVMNQGVISNQLGLAGIPREAEETIVARNIILAGYTGARLHIAPVSTKGSVEWIRRAKRDGVHITCGTCPHYFSLTEEAAGAYNTLAKTFPPLRTQADADAIAEGLADGTIDVIASGHAPDTIESVTAEFTRASFALSSLETAFPAAYTALAGKGILPLDTLVNRMSATPAGILSISGKGRIAAGYDADLFLLDTAKPHTVDASQFASKAKYSPYHGQTMACTVTATLVNGRIVYLRDE